MDQNRLRLNDLPQERAKQGEIAVKECANMISKTTKLCLNWEICVYFRKTKKECRYFRESVCREGRPGSERP
jgi:hypothetical protein